MSRLGRLLESDRRLRQPADQQNKRKLIASFEQLFRGDPTVADMNRCLAATGDYAPKKLLKPYVPGLLVRRSRRQAGLAKPAIKERGFVAVAEYLAFDTSETPDREPDQILEEIKADILNPRLIDHRMVDASAYALAVDGGLERVRHRLWESGKIIRMAQTKICDLDIWANLTILNDWAPISEILERRYPPDPPPVAAKVHPHRAIPLYWPAPTYSVVSWIVDTGLVTAEGAAWSEAALADWPLEPAKSGQDAPVCNDHEDRVHGDQLR